MKNKYNLFDWLLVILLMSLATGYLGKVFTSPTHIIAFAFAPFLVNLRIPRARTILLWFFIVWLYGLLSIIWSHFTIWSVRGLEILSIHLLICLEIIFFSKKAKNPLLSIANGWFLAFLITLPIALWEISTDQHVMTIAHEDILYRDNGTGVLLDKHIAAVTFYNSNTYCLFLVFTFLFLLYKLTKTKGLSNYLIIVPTFLALVYILFQNASRGSLLSVAIMFGVFIWITSIRGSSKKKKFALALVAVLVAVYYYYGDLLFEAILYRTETSGMFEDNERIILWTNTWMVIKDYYGLGAGLNTMIPLLEPFGNTTISYSHNLFLELALEGGIFFLIPFVLYLIQIYKSGRRSFDVGNKIVLLGALFALPFYTVINSENFRPTFIWVFFVSLYPFVSSSFENIKEE